MSVSDEKDDVAALLNEHELLEQWLHPEIKDSDAKSVFAPSREGVHYRCPCCHYKTLGERGGYDICPVCFWEDDGQDNDDAATDRVFGPNQISLKQARENFRRFGACNKQSIQRVRLPLPAER